MIKIMEFGDNLSSLWKQVEKSDVTHTLFLSYDWHNMWAKTFKNTGKPWTLVVNHDIIAPFVRLDTTLTFSGGKEIADYLDIIGPNDEKARAWGEILQFCKTQGIINLHLFNIPENSPTKVFFETYQQNDFAITLSQEDTTPRLPLPLSWNEHLENLDRKDRHEIKRKMMKFESQYPGVALYKSDKTIGDIDEVIKLMKYDLRKQTFLSAEMESFFKQIPKVFSFEIIILLLKHGDINIAAMVGFKSGTSFLTYNSGFDQKNYTGAGFYMKAQSIKWAIEQKFTEYNFLQGNERYKYELGGKDFFVYTVNGKL